MGRQRPRLSVDDLMHEPEQAVGLEGVAQRTELVQHAAQRPEVRSRVVAPVLADLRGEVVRRPDYCAGLQAGVGEEVSIRGGRGRIRLPPAPDPACL